ncbi:hypothetical protein POM88_032925 [Heracleum sosnowskyi]|uniref:Uncharacterized protein n=1 Tax=Heracleum sosnowskyi TaxID=360622 RepID=A0AAD8I089_9APIA|nr:hypothetical protein POM88_032925 [Heracleum sosnowskyi]
MEVETSWEFQLVIASSCGLVCFMDNDSRNEVYLCNPITRHYRKLKEPPGSRLSDYSALALSVNKNPDVDYPLAEIVTGWRGGDESVIRNGVLYLLIYSTGGAFQRTVMDC